MNKITQPIFIFLLACLFTLAIVSPVQAEVIVCPSNQAAKIPDRLKAKLFDTAVNTGHNRANRILQQSINTLNPHARLKVDGALGPQSKKALCGLSEAALLKVYVQKQSAFYRGIVARKPSQQRFIKGWLRRAAWLPQ